MFLIQVFMALPFGGDGAIARYNYVDNFSV